MPGLSYLDGGKPGALPLDQAGASRESDYAPLDEPFRIG
jgi:hypothetical protein